METEAHSLKKHSMRGGQLEENNITPKEAAEEILDLALGNLTDNQKSELLESSADVPFPDADFIPRVVGHRFFNKAYDLPLYIFSVHPRSTKELREFFEEKFGMAFTSDEVENVFSIQDNVVQSLGQLILKRVRMSQSGLHTR